MLVDKIIEATSEKVKATFGLVVAEMVLDELKSDKEGYLLAREALNLSWDWVEEENISGDTLAEYVDSPTEKDLGIREGYYADNQSMICAIAVLTTAIALVAHFAYELEGSRDRPAPIWEVDEEILYELLEFASRTKIYDENKVKYIQSFLLNNYNDKKQKIDRNVILSELKNV